MSNETRGSGSIKEFDSEDFVIARSGLNKIDLKTVVLQVNGRHFKFSSVQSFKNFALIAMANAVEFEKASRPKTNAQLKAFN